MNDADSFLPNGNPGGNVVAGTAVFLIVALLEAYVYYKNDSRRLVRTGGDYVWMSRSIGAWIPTISNLRFSLHRFSVHSDLARIGCSR